MLTPAPMRWTGSLSDSGWFYRDGGKESGPFFRRSSLHSPTMRFETAKKWTRFPARLEPLNPTVRQVPENKVSENKVDTDWKDMQAYNRHVSIRLIEAW